MLREKAVSRKEITLSQAAVLLRMSYNQVQRLVMRGDLKGGQDAQRHWWVDAGHVATILRDRREEQGAA